MINNKITRGKNINKIIFAYLAGFIDGEGCINIYKTTPNKHHLKPRYELNVCIYNTHKPTMDYLQEIINSITKCNVRLRHRTGWKEHWKDSCEIRCGTQQAKILLENVLPYMVTKKEQAKLALEFIKTKEIKKGNQFRPLTKDESDFYDDCWNKMSMMNSGKRRILLSSPAETNRDDTK